MAHQKRLFCFGLHEKPKHVTGDGGRPAGFEVQSDRAAGAVRQIVRQKVPAGFAMDHRCAGKFGRLTAKQCIGVAEYRIRYAIAGARVTAQQVIDVFVQTAGPQGLRAHCRRLVEMPEPAAGGGEKLRAPVGMAPPPPQLPIDARLVDPLHDQNPMLGQDPQEGRHGEAGEA